MSKLIVLFAVVCVLCHVVSAKKVKDEKEEKYEKEVKVPEEKTKSVSSDRVHNGGRKGPTSVNNGGLPGGAPVVIPLPIIPHSKKNSNTKEEGVGKKKSTKEKENQKASSKSSKTQDNTTKNNTYVNGVELEGGKRKKSSGSKKSLLRKKHRKLSVEEEAIKRSWIASKGDIPNAEGVYLTDAQRAIRKAWLDTTSNKIPDEDGEGLNEETKEMMRQWLSMEDDIIPSREAVDEDEAVPGLETVHLSDEEEKMKREWLAMDSETLLPGTENVHLSPDEERMKREWLAMDSEALIPGVENAHFASDLKALLRDTVQAFDVDEAVFRRSIGDEEEKEEDEYREVGDYDEEHPLTKRSVDDMDLMIMNAEEMTDRHMQVRDLVDDDDSEQAVLRGMVTRQAEAAEADHTDSVEEAQVKLDNAERAAKQLTALEKKLGIDPEHLVSDTHTHIAELTEQKTKLDANIREHIEKTSAAEKRSDVTNSDQSVDAAKRQLEEDHGKIEEINTELKQLKDVELMATGLEVAKFLARERARNNLEVARQRSQINTPPAATQPTASMQQPTVGLQQLNTAVQQPNAALQQPMKPNVQSNVAWQQQTVPQQSNTAVLQPNIGMPLQNAQAVQSMFQPSPQPFFGRPMGATSEVPGVVNNPSFSYTPSRPMHQAGDQRHINRPSASPYKQSLTDYFSQYLQTKSAQESNFQRPLTAVSAPPVYQQPAAQLTQYQQQFVPQPQQAMQQPVQQQAMFAQQTVQPQRIVQQAFMRPQPQYSAQEQQFLSAFNQQGQRPGMSQAVAPEVHANGDMRHSPARPKTKVGKADHESTHKEEKPDKDDNDWGALSFPGGTYSAPPTWLHQPRLNGVVQQQQMIPQQLQSPPQLQQTVWQHQPMPFARPQPPSFPNAHRVEATSGVAPLSILHPYTPPAPALTNVQMRPFGQQFQQTSGLSAMPGASYSSMTNPVLAPLSTLAPASFTGGSSSKFNQLSESLFPERANTEGRPGTSNLVNTYVQQQQQPIQQNQQQVHVGEVIRVSPQDETYVIPPVPPPPPPPPPPPQLSGMVPGQWGAVDAARYAGDGLDRMRQPPKKNEPNASVIHDTANFNANQVDDPAMKREYENLNNLNQRYKDTVQASEAVTHIESAIGFDPGSIAKMVDFVKSAAVKDVELSRETISKDEETLNKIRGETKKSDIEKKSDISEDNVAYEHAHDKLKSDQAVLLDAQDRLEKIKRMEMIVTEVEVAKYIAVQNVKNGIHDEQEKIETMKRENIYRPGHKKRKKKRSS